MKILMMFPFSPNPPPHDLGPSKRSVPFLNETLKRHEVSVLTFGSPNEEANFRKHYSGICRNIVFVNNTRPRFVNFFRRIVLLLSGRGYFYILYRRAMQAELDRLVARESFDLIYCASVLLGFYRFPTGIPVIGDAHNVEHDILYRSFRHLRNIFSKLLWFAEYKIGKRVEVANCRTFDVVTTTTERDARIFHANMPDLNITVISNGVDPKFLELMNILPEPNTLVFPGLMSYLPNPHGVLYFLDSIFPLVLAQRPDARLYVVGKDPPKSLRSRASRNVIVTGYVEDVRPYIARCQVFIIPLLIGGGIRGKALEAMAMKKAIVSTSVGYEGIPLEHGKSVLVADTPQDFADAVSHLFRNETLRNALGKHAQEIILEKYNWEEKGLELERVFQSTVVGRNAHAPGLKHSTRVS